MIPQFFDNQIVCDLESRHGLEGYTRVWVNQSLAPTNTNGTYANINLNLYTISFSAIGLTTTNLVGFTAGGVVYNPTNWSGSSGTISHGSYTITWTRTTNTLVFRSPVAFTALGYTTNVPTGLTQTLGFNPLRFYYGYLGNYRTFAQYHTDGRLLDVVVSSDFGFFSQYTSSNINDRTSFTGIMWYSSGGSVRAVTLPTIVAYS